MSISFAHADRAHVSFMRMFGVGLTLAGWPMRPLVRMLLVAGLHARDGPDELVDPQTACAVS